MARQILTLADTKRILGIRYSDWLLGSPSIETGIAASSMAQDEWGHARLLYSMLRDFAFDPYEVEHTRSAERYYSLPALDHPFADWAEFVTAVVVADGALAVALESFAEGTFPLARSRVPKMLAEEEFHQQFGAAWFARLAKGKSDSTARLNSAIKKMLPTTLVWLAPGDETYASLVADGSVWPTKRVRERYQQAVTESLALAGVALDDRWLGEAVQSQRAHYDTERRRAAGAPGEDAVERARGDLNRALFVE